jgi:ATP-dependent RNA helicase DDX52/ROK1
VLEKIKQSIEYCTNEYGKVVYLKNLIIEGGFVPPALIFVQEKSRAKQLYYELKKILKSTVGGKEKLEVLTGEKSKEERQEIIEKFDKGEFWALITTDLIARGIDFKNTNLVINYDFPNSMLTYIHRVGRTGRA